MKTRLILLAVMLLAACTPTATTTPTIIPEATSIPATATATLTPVPPTETPTPEPPTATPTPLYPPEGMGPANFPAGVNPLTGLEVADPTLLDRRPMIIKIPNLPRNVRPQWGLSLADMVFEYYTEQGSTRFAALFYGQDATQVGPIRSGRMFDVDLIRMYKAIFAYGSADWRVNQRLFGAEFYQYLVLENDFNCPPMCRLDPKGRDYLITNTAELSKYITNLKLENSRQNLDGMFFKLEPPAGGAAGSQAWIRYSGAIYNRWDYDAASGVYLRFSDTVDDINRQNEVYAQLTDQLTNQPIRAANVLVMIIPHEYYLKQGDTEIVDMIFNPVGDAYLFRDGQVYKVRWQRQAANAVLSLIDAEGNPFPFKPGNTWVEVIGTSSKLEQKDTGLRFSFSIP